MRLNLVLLLLATQTSWAATPIKEYELPKHFPDAPSISPDNSLFALGYKGAIQIVEVTTGLLVQRLDDSESDISTTVFSPDSKEVLAGRKDGKISRWNIERRTKFAEWDAHKGRDPYPHLAYINRITYSPDGATFFSGGRDGKICWWSNNKNELLHEFDAQHGPIDQIEITDDGRYLVSGDRSAGTFMVWDLTDRLKVVETNSALSDILDIELVPNQNIALVGHLSQRVLFWDLESGLEFSRFHFPGDMWKLDKDLSIESISVISPFAFIGISYGGLVCYDMEQMKEIGKVDIFKENLELVHYIPETGNLLTVGGDESSIDSRVKIWKIEELFPQTVSVPLGKEMDSLIGRGICTSNSQLSLDLERCLTLSPNVEGTKLMDLAFVEVLDLSGQEVGDLSGIECCRNLKRLKAGNNKISDLRPLSNLASLEKLDLEGNQIENLSPLRDLTNLISLNIRNNKIRDVSPLVQMEKLMLLDVSDNEVDEVDSLYHGIPKGAVVILKGNPLDGLIGWMRMRGLKSKELKVVY